MNTDVVTIPYEDGGWSKWIRFVHTDGTWRRYDFDPSGRDTGTFCPTGWDSDEPPPDLPPDRIPI